MLKGFSQLAGLLKNMPSMQALQEEMERLKQKIGSLTAEGTSGGGMVTAKVNGRMELLSCKLTDDALALKDREMLEDLIVAAVNQASDKARQLVAEETSKTAGGLGLPPGLNLPGLS
jgi:DNA-binding YbaB/EbfC family protein